VGVLQKRRSREGMTYTHTEMMAYEQVPGSNPQERRSQVCWNSYIHV
jgi:hypothetical protein